MTALDDIAIPARYQTVRKPAAGNLEENRIAAQSFSEEGVEEICQRKFWVPEGHPTGIDPFVGAMGLTVLPNEEIREGYKVMIPRVANLGSSRHLGDLSVAQLTVDLFRVRIFENERYLEYLGTYCGVVPGEGSNLLQNGRGAWFRLSPNFQYMPVVPPGSQMDVRAAALEQEVDYESQDRDQQGTAQPNPLPAEPGNPLSNAPPAVPSTFRLAGGGSGRKQRREEEDSGSSSDNASSESEDEDEGGDTEDTSGKRGKGTERDTGSGVGRRGKRRRRRERDEKSRNRVRDEAGVKGKCMDPDFCFRTLDDVYVRGRTKDDGNVKVVKIQAILRLVSWQRRLDIIDDLQFMSRQVWARIGLAIADPEQRRVTPGFPSLAEIARIADTPVFASENRLAAFFHCDHMVLSDPSGWNLRWHALPGMDVTWGLEPTVGGKRSLATATANLELSLTLLFDEEFRGSLVILQGILDTPFSGVSDGIIRHTIEMGVQEWANDVCRCRQPTGVFLGDLSMGSPKACAHLLEVYMAGVWASLVSATTRRSGATRAPFCLHPLERYPHHRWAKNEYPIHRELDWDPALTEPHVVEKPGVRALRSRQDGSSAPSDGKGAADGKKTPRAPASGPPAGKKGSSGHCPWHVAEVLALDGKSGPLACNIPDCDLEHTLTTLDGVGKALTERDVDAFLVGIRLREKIRSTLRDRIPGWG